MTSRFAKQIDFTFHLLKKKTVQKCESVCHVGPCCRDGTGNG